MYFDGHNRILVHFSFLRRLLNSVHGIVLRCFLRLLLCARVDGLGFGLHACDFGVDLHVDVHVDVHVGVVRHAGGW